MTDPNLTEAAIEQIDRGVTSLMRDCIGRALMRKVPDLSAGQILSIQDVVMDQLTRFGA